jgi:hypothetical protein
VVIGGGPRWSYVAWGKALNAWKAHGEHNHLILELSDEDNKRRLAEQFAKRYRIAPNGAPPPLRQEDLRTREERDQYEAAQFLFEYTFYRNVSNFPHHWNRALVEALPETIACRKYFFKADQAYLRGERAEALDLYSPPKGVADPAWGSYMIRDPKTGERRPPTPLEAWRDLVLLKNKDYRRDSFTQETSAEVQIRYLRVFNAQKGKGLKKEVGKLAAFLPLVPKFGYERPRQPIVPGPFEVNDGEGTPLITEAVMDTVLERLGLSRRGRPAERPPMGPMGPMRPATPPGVPGAPSSSERP